MSELVTKLVAHVKAYATEHYAEGKGWDYVVETMSDQEIAEAIGKARTEDGAVKKVAENCGLSVLAERDADAKALADFEREAATPKAPRYDHVDLIARIAEGQYDDVIDSIRTAVRTRRSELKAEARKAARKEQRRLEKAGA